MENEFIEKLLEKHSNTKDPLIEILHEIQEEYNYIPKDYVYYLSENMGLSLSKIYSVISFYSSFKLSKRGKHLIRVCLGTACSVMKNKANSDFIKEYLKIDFGQTSSDNLFTFEPVNCLGTCSLAPVVEIDGKIHGKVTPDKMKELLDNIISKEKES